MLSHESTQPAPYAPESFVVEVFAELDPDTIQKRWQHVNVVLRLSMLSGLQMQLDATLNLLCDMATEIATCEKSLVYFWDEGHEQMELRLVRGIEKKESVLQEVSAGNVMNLWVVQYGRPLLISRGHHRQADTLLEMMDAASALVVPLFVRIEWLDRCNFSWPAKKAFSGKMRNFCGSCPWLQRTFSPANPPTKA
jgi:transcriptional regulator with GAF, ATPase, and Fis domain